MQKPETYEDYGIFGVDPRKTGNQYLLCPSMECRTRKKSKLKTLGVNTEKQAWICHHCGFTGGLRKTEEYLQPQIPVAPMPVVKPSPLSAGLTDKHRSWLHERGFTDNTIDYFRITSEVTWMYEKGEYKEGNANCIVFPYFRNSELINKKYRGPGKRFKLSTGGELIAFNQDCLLKSPETLVICEGEPDAMVVHQCWGESVISPPNGANLHKNNLEWLDKIYDQVSGCRKIILAVDNDEAGESLKADLIRRFETDKIWIAQMPEGCKDCNDVLKNLGAEAVRQVIEGSRQVPIEGIIDDDELQGQVFKIYDNGYPKGVKTGWRELDALCQWLRGEFVAVTGIPNHGKSPWCADFMMRMAKKNGWKFGVWSAESDADIEAMNMVQRYIGLPAMGIDRMSREQFSSGIQYIQDHFKFFSIEESRDNTLDKILEKGGELVRRYGIDCLLIDPWSYVEKDIGRLTDNQFFESCLPKIRLFRKKYNCMIIVVAHPRKIEYDQKTGKLKVPGPYDINGSNQWYGAPDKIYSVYCHYNDDGTMDYHEIHMMKQKKWFLGKPKGVVQMKMNKIGVFNEVSSLPQINSEAPDYKKFQAGEKYGNDEIGYGMDQDGMPF